MRDGRRRRRVEVNPIEKHNELEERNACPVNRPGRRACRHHEPGCRSECLDPASKENNKYFNCGEFQKIRLTASAISFSHAEMDSGEPRIPK